MTSTSAQSPPPPGIPRPAPAQHLHPPGNCARQHSEQRSIRTSAGTAEEAGKWEVGTVPAPASLGSAGEEGKAFALVVSSMWGPFGCSRAARMCPGSGGGCGEGVSRPPCLALAPPSTHFRWMTSWGEEGHSLFPPPPPLTENPSQRSSWHLPLLCAHRP